MKLKLFIAFYFIVIGVANANFYLIFDVIAVRFISIYATRPKTFVNVYPLLTAMINCQMEYLKKFFIDG